MMDGPLIAGLFGQFDPSNPYSWAACITMGALLIGGSGYFILFKNF